MATLKEGATGPEVIKLQERLKELGFDPGSADGEFGPGTEAAVMAFQRNAGLLPDGIVGPRTQAALALPAPDPLPSVIPGVTPTVVSKMFPSTPLRNIATHLPPVLNALVADELQDKPMVLMALATIRAET
ncbi:MAG: peptidoglycan-binding protein [Deltaproteobacteria bacterium]|nr:peptidoglycan-binding protein [Deltaproteobacteria bacterium]